MTTEPDKEIYADKVKWYLFVAAFLIVVFFHSGLHAFTLTVVDSGGNPIYGYRWLVEENTTNITVPGAQVADSISVNIHKSYAPVAYKGSSLSSSTTIDLPSDTPYFVTVLPLSGYSPTGYAMSGTTVAVGESSVSVVLNSQRILTAQITIYVFEDNYSINNAPDIGAESGLAGFSIIMHDAAGQMMTDAFGNMLGTTYQQDGDGNFIFDADGNPEVLSEGSGTITSDSNGEADIKYLAPGKYGILAVPPEGEGWIQTSTIEGTHTIDAWVKANEPPNYIEGFGAALTHVAFGFVKPATLPWATTPPSGTGTITGKLVNNHFSRPPLLSAFFAGSALDEGYIGLNDPATGEGLYAAPCSADGTFTISDVPAGTYQLVTWDVPLDTLFGFNTVTVGTGETVTLGNVLTFRWFGTLEGSVFYDSNGNGFRDSGETGIANQGVTLRFRDGSIYQATATTPPDGEYSFDEVFPFFKWLVAEVDFARLKATGMTTVIDNGGEIQADNGWVMPSRGKLNPQAQAEVNPNTGNNLSRSEIGEVLTQAMMLFLGQTNVIDWGKAAYAAGGNGGISGIVYYSTTRAENDPRFAAGEEWEPGVPRVQVNLYLDRDEDGGIDDVDGDGNVTLTDVDNYPFGWSEGGAKGSEDVDRNYSGQTPGVFDFGDAIQITSTDSWDDNMPTGSIYESIPVVHGQQVRNGFDNFGTWDQVRPGIFDGGYAFGDLSTDTYIVEAIPPPGYEIVKEEDKNVDFGDSFEPSKLSLGKLTLPPVCVGDDHTVPEQFSIFPGEAPYAGQTRPLCNRKQIKVVDDLNAAVDFFFFTIVPKAARAVGFVNNDLSAEFNAQSPIYGEKAAPSWIPISFKDWSGRELVRVYTDEWGGYNALLPSTYTVNVPSPTGVSPNMINIILNEPIMDDPNNPGQTMVDPFYDSGYSVTTWTLDFWPGKTTYLDTPVVPVAGFVGYPNYVLDVEPANGTPVISAVNGPNGGPLVCNAGETITITSAGTVTVPNPDYDPNTPGSQPTINRDFGFGNTSGTVTVSGTALTGIVWSNASITATVQAGVTTGRLVVTRGDNSLSTDLGITLHVLNAAQCASSVIHVPGAYSTIQAAIDAANNGDLIIVESGTYNENPIMWKKVRLQGSGAHSTIISANPNPSERIAAWHTKIQEILGLPGPTDPFAAKETPGIMVLGGISGYPFEAANPALIDGFTVLGALVGGGIYVNNDAHYLTISSNKINGNQGNYGGGVTLGTPDTGESSSNTNITIQYNRIVKNGGVRGGGGVVINGVEDSTLTGADDYTVSYNKIIGNFSRYSGGGVAHVGLSKDGMIDHNKILFNEVFFGTLLEGAGDGGGIYIAGAIGGTALSVGAGSVTINANLIQGNLSGSGYGGGIRGFKVNGEDVSDNPGTPASWYSLNLYNNMIVNNVAGMAGGGIALQDCARVNIVNNTIAHNDSTATAAAAFDPGNHLQSNPQGSGIVADTSTELLDTATVSLSTALLDNIIWHNRSYYWNGSLNNYQGALVAYTNTYWDLQDGITQTPAYLNPLNSVLTDTTGYDPSNSASNPLFITGYLNSLLTAIVMDEGGNAISVRFTNTQESDGNYHISSGSGAENLGGVTHPSATYPLTDTDYDGDTRPATPNVDSGADQL